MASTVESSSAEPLERLFELSSDMRGVASFDGFFTLLSPSWHEQLGWTRQELMAEPFISFVHPDDIKPARKSVLRARPGGEW